MSATYKMTVNIAGKEPIQVESKVTFSPDISDKLPELARKKLRATIQAKDKQTLNVHIADINLTLQITLGQSYGTLNRYDQGVPGIVQIDSSGIGELKEGGSKLLISPRRD